MSSGQDVADLVRGERHIHVGGNPTIGELRNLGCEAARGEVIAHWDDDDFSGPGRLAAQIERLTATGKSVTGYRSMRFTDGRDWWQYNGRGEYVLGTSLCYRRDWWARSRFPGLQTGEDTEFVIKAARAGVLDVVESGDMWATIHSNNTSPRQLGSKQYSKIA